MAYYEDKVFDGEEVELTGNTYFCCVFLNCVVTLIDDGRFTSVDSCEFDGCELLGDGWPKPIMIVDENGVQHVH